MTENLSWYKKDSNVKKRKLLLHGNLKIGPSSIVFSHFKIYPHIMESIMESITSGNDSESGNPGRWVTVEVRKTLTELNIECVGKTWSRSPVPPYRHSCYIHPKSPSCVRSRMPPHNPTCVIHEGTLVISPSCLVSGLVVR
jgi:hypothetical protein